MSRPDPAHTPVLVGVGQSIEREGLVTVVDLTEQATLAAFEDAPGLTDRIERITTVSVIFSPCGTAPSTELAARLGLSGVRCETTTAGGNTPQWLVTRAAAEIAGGELKATLIVGAEATRSMRAANPGADFIGAADAGDTDERAEVEPDPVVGPEMTGVLSGAEVAAGFVRPAEVYPVFDSALAAAAGRSGAEQRAYLGQLLAPFSRVAAANPFAWSATDRAKRFRRSTIGITCPRRLISPQMKSGTSGILVIWPIRMISWTRMMSTPYSSLASWKLTIWATVSA